MKSLFLTYWYPNKKNPNYCGFVREHALAIANAGVAVNVLAFTFLPSNSLYKETVARQFLLPNLEEHHVYVESFFYRFIYVNPFHLWYIAWNYYKKNLAGFDPDIIHSNVVHPGGVVGHWLSEKLKKPHVITEHWTRLFRYMDRNWLSFLGRNAYDKAKAITVVSQYSKGYVSKYSKNKNIIVVPNVVENVIFTYQPKERNKAIIEFLYVGYLNWPKLPFLTLDALEKAQKSSGKPFVLHIIGIGELEPKVREHIKSLSYQVNLLGGKPKPEIANYMQKTDFYIHAADIETFSIVTAEALSTGTPVIASNNTALPELVNESNGVLAENDTDSFAKGILKALNTDFDNESISQKMEGRFSYLRIGHGFLDVYKSIAAF